MPTQATPHPPDAALRWTTDELLRITLLQLRSWEAEAARHRVALPLPDELAWEGTEIDVRRTVL